MANEILVLEGDGDKSYSLLFLFPISVPIQVNGTNVGPSPSSRLPERAGSILTTQQKAALDNGTSMFVLANFNPATGLSNTQLSNRIRAIYVEQLIEWTRWYQQTYKYVGTWISV
jgi:hypothetical protein